MKYVTEHWKECSRTYRNKQIEEKGKLNTEIKNLKLEKSKIDKINITLQKEHSATEKNKRALEIKVFEL